MEYFFLRIIRIKLLLCIMKTLDLTLVFHTQHLLMVMGGIEEFRHFSLQKCFVPPPPPKTKYLQQHMSQWIPTQLWDSSSIFKWLLMMSCLQMQNMHSFCPLWLTSHVRRSLGQREKWNRHSIDFLCAATWNVLGLFCCLFFVCLFSFLLFKDLSYPALHFLSQIRWSSQQRW